MKIFIGFNILILLVIILRALARDRVSRRVRYAMWIVLPVYLVISLFAFQSITIRIPRKVEEKVAPAAYARHMDNETMMAEGYLHDQQISQEDTMFIEPAATAGTPSVSQAAVQDETPITVNDSGVITTGNERVITATQAVKIVYLLGILSISFVILVSNIIFIGRLHRARSYYGRSSYGNLKVFRLAGTGSPFLLGKNIYVSRSLNEGTEAYDFAICHEYCHFRQGDSFWLFTEYLILCIFWFDPLVWIARKLMRDDRELSVDEKVISIKGQGKRSRYSETLLQFFSGIREDEPVMNVATTMSGRNRPFIKRRVRGIMEGTRKSIAATLAVTFILSAAAGCALFRPKVTGEGETVSADTPWYNVESIECGREYEGLPNIEQRVIGKTSAGYVTFINAGDAGSPVSDLCLYSEQGEKIASMDVISRYTSKFPDEEYFTLTFYYDSFYISDDTVKYIRGSWYGGLIKIYDIDIINDDITLERVFRLDVTGDIHSLTYFGICGEDYVFVESAGHPLRIHTVDPDGNIRVFPSDDAEHPSYPTAVTPPIPISDHEMLFVDISGLTYDIWVFDLQTQELFEAGEEYDWISGYARQYGQDRASFNPGAEGLYYFTTDTEIVKVDTNNRTAETVALMENIDINRNLMGSTSHLFACKVFDADEDSILFTVNPYHDCGFSIYRAQRAENNPNAGKTIITADPWFNEIVFDAAYLFNRTDEDYFVRIVSNNYSEYLYLDGETDQDIEIAGRYNSNRWANQMLVDLIAGDCPDIVFYADVFSQLKNGNCMIDLSPYYEENDLRDQVFTNIVDASRVDGKLYSFPLSFELYGILVNRDRYDNPGNGMTFEQYDEFMHGYCNGFNPVGNTRDEFMRNCMATSYDLLQSNGSIDLDCEAFRQMAEYTCENVMDNDIDNIFAHSADWCQIDIYGTNQWLDEVKHNFPDGQEDLIGFPSPDGRGPAAEIRSCVSITKSCRSPEGAWRFICMLCNTEIQRYQCSPIANRVDSYFPINREACSLVMEDGITAYNDRLDTNYSWNEGTLTYAQPGDLDHLEEIIGSIDHVTYVDSDIDIIVYEEMQAYYAGDKTLDEVIEIMNDRAQTVLNERG